ncbi:MAG: hypothetical protein ACREF3_17865 [Acetobacteraceae bacterium]
MPLKSSLLLLAVLFPLTGCAVADFAARQNEWNASHGMGSMNTMPTFGGQTESERAAAEKDAETQRNIKHGEDLENEEARKAGLGPSPTEGMNCSTTTISTGSANSGTSTSHTTCHN